MQTPSEQINNEVPGVDIQLSPEKALLKAVLERAVSDSLGLPESTPQHLKRGARNWIFKKEVKFKTKNDWPYTFLQVCEYLDLCSLTIRKYILTMSKLPTSELLSELPDFNQRENSAHLKAHHLTQEEQAVLQYSLP